MGRIVGIVKSSFIDYPGKASTVLFLGGCNFECGYCHNVDVVRDQAGEIGTEALFAFLKKRKRFLDAVCVSGGEPTIHGQWLYELISQIREMGYLVKLDTNGTQPQLLSRLLEEGLISYVAMDLKGPFRRYGEIAGASAAQLKAVRQSAALLIEAGEWAKAGERFGYEFRTTVCKNQLAEEDLRELAEDTRGAQLLYLQTFHDSGKLLEPEADWTAYSQDEMETLAERVRQTGCIGTVRVR